MELMEILQARRSVRHYTDDPVEMSDLMKILQAGLLSASSRGRKPWEFIVVKDKENLKRMSRCRINSAEMLAEAQYAIVVIADPDMTDVWVEDCSIAMSNMHLMATSLGIGSCWVQARLRMDTSGRSTENFVRNIVAFPKAFRLEAILALGIPAEKLAPYDLGSLPMGKIHWNKF